MSPADNIPDGWTRYDLVRAADTLESLMRLRDEPGSWPVIWRRAIDREIARVSRESDSADCLTPSSLALFHRLKQEKRVLQSMRDPYAFLASFLDPGPPPHA